MTKNVLTVEEDWTVAELATFLEDHSISGAPVVDRKGALIGVVSVTDIARSGAVADTHAYYRDGLERALAREEAKSFHVGGDARKVRDIMTPVVFSVDSTATVKEVADTMIRGRIHRLFVMQRGKLVGVISALDLLTLVRDA